MNKLERDILDVLTADCRCPAEKVAVMVGEEKEKVENAIRAMERRGTIVKYAALVNLDEEEDECVEALIEVKVTPQSGSGFMSGAYDFLVIVESKSIKGVSRFISECISTFDCVISTATHFILKKYKIEGAMTKKQPRGRLSIQP